jgi:RNA recognition motif-containing protein
MDIQKLSCALAELSVTIDADSGHVSSPPHRVVDRRASVPFTNYDVAMLSPDADAATAAEALKGPPSAESSRRSSSQSEHPMSPEEEARCRSNLYISLLGDDVTDADVRELFESFGPIDSAVVMRNIHTGRSRGIAFVQFLDEECAKRAVDAANGMVLRGRAISVQVASRRAMYAPGTPTNRVFVRNIPADVSEAALSKHCSIFGEVLKVTLHNDSAKAQAMYPNEASTPASTPPPRIAFLTFTSVETAKRAAAALHNSLPFASCYGVPLLAKVAEDCTKRQERISRSQSLSSTPTSHENSRRTSNELGVLCGGERDKDRSLGIMLRTISGRTPSSDLGSQGPVGSSPPGAAVTSPAAAAARAAAAGGTPLSSPSPVACNPPLPVAEDAAPVQGPPSPLTAPRARAEFPPPPGYAADSAPQPSPPAAVASCDSSLRPAGIRLPMPQCGGPMLAPIQTFMMPQGPFQVPYAGFPPQLALPAWGPVQCPALWPPGVSSANGGPTAMFVGAAQPGAHVAVQYCSSPPQYPHASFQCGPQGFPFAMQPFPVIQGLALPQTQQQPRCPTGPMAVSVGPWAQQHQQPVMIGGVAPDRKEL